MGFGFRAWGLGFRVGASGLGCPRGTENQMEMGMEHDMEAGFVWFIAVVGSEGTRQCPVTPRASNR